MTMICARCDAQIPDSYYTIEQDGGAAQSAVCWPCWRADRWWRRFTSWHERDRQKADGHPVDVTLQAVGIRQISHLDNFASVFFSGRHRGCVRCRGAMPDWPKYTGTEGLRHWQANIPHFFCLSCWDELTPEGRYQWLLMGLAAWMSHHRPDLGYKPIPDDESNSSQARYRDKAYQAEQWRRLLFEPEGWDGCAQLGPDRRLVDGAVPSYGPDYKPYMPCYVNAGPLAAPHEWHDIPEMGLALCTVCHAWSRLPDHESCLPWRKDQENTP